MNARHHRSRPTRRAFTLVELVIVVVIIGMIASMAIPRLSRGSQDANAAAARADLFIVRSAVQRYAAEHRNRFPGNSAIQVAAQLTQYTDVSGNTSSTRSATFIYGPYVREISAAPVGVNAGSAAIRIDAVNSPPQPNTASGEGWLYNPNTGEFFLNDGVTAVNADVVLSGKSSLGG